MARCVSLNLIVCLCVVDSQHGNNEEEQDDGGAAETTFPRERLNSRGTVQDSESSGGTEKVQVHHADDNILNNNTTTHTVPVVIKHPELKPHVPSRTAQRPIYHSTTTPQLPASGARHVQARAQAQASSSTRPPSLPQTVKAQTRGGLTDLSHAMARSESQPTDSRQHPARATQTPVHVSTRAHLTQQTTRVPGKLRNGDQIDARNGGGRSGHGDRREAPQPSNAIPSSSRATQRPSLTGTTPMQIRRAEFLRRLRQESLKRSRPPGFQPSSSSMPLNDDIYDWDDDSDDDACSVHSAKAVLATVVSSSRSLLSRPLPPTPRSSSTRSNAVQTSQRVKHSPVTSNGPAGTASTSSKEKPTSAIVEPVKNSFLSNSPAMVISTVFPRRVEEQRTLAAIDANAASAGRREHGARGGGHRTGGEGNRGLGVEEPQRLSRTSPLSATYVKLADGCDDSGIGFPDHQERRSGGTPKQIPQEVPAAHKIRRERRSEESREERVESKKQLSSAKENVKVGVKKEHRRRPHGQM